jgi:hypothetical protein
MTQMKELMGNEASAPGNGLWKLHFGVRRWREREKPPVTGGPSPSPPCGEAKKDTALTHHPWSMPVD